MSRFALLLTLAAIVPACPPSPSPPHPDVVDAAPRPQQDASSCSFPSTPCGDACRNLAALGCPNSSPAGLCCGDWLCGLPAYALPTSQIKCALLAKSKNDALRCGVVCLP